MRAVVHQSGGAAAADAVRFVTRSHKHRDHMPHSRHLSPEAARKRGNPGRSAILHPLQAERDRFGRLLWAMSQGTLEKVKPSISKRPASFRSISLLSLKEARKHGKLDRFPKLHPLQVERDRFDRLLDAMSRGVLEKEK